MENVPQSRRKFIKTLALASASLVLLWRYLTPPSLSRRQVVARAPRSDVPVEGALVFSQKRVALMREEGDTVYALDLVCTHLGCTVTVAGSGLSCPCHGSRFDRQGRVLKGPADRTLRRLKVEERDGIIEVVV